jgi:hypothetical protein
MEWPRNIKILWEVKRNNDIHGVAEKHKDTLGSKEKQRYTWSGLET